MGFGVWGVYLSVFSELLRVEVLLESLHLTYPLLAHCRARAPAEIHQVRVWGDGVWGGRVGGTASLCFGVRGFGCLGIRVYCLGSRV